MASASSAPASFFQAARCGYSPSPRFSNNCNYNIRNGGVAAGVGGSSSASSPSSSSHHGFNFSSSGVNNIWKPQGIKSQATNTATQGRFSSSSGAMNGKSEPDHLLVLVHGILASPSDWTYVEAELKRRLGKNFLIHASSCNTYTKTFSGIDGAGKRLADEVMQVVQKRESLKRISFLAHSLGGLFARYAIAVLYSENAVNTGTSIDVAADTSLPNSNTACSSRRGMIAGLEPINFITLATPHLGVRGRKQLPFLLGIPILEKLVLPIAPIIVGRTGSQLFLTDGKPNKPPLLLRMTSDCEDGKFLSALGAFRCRVLYANVSYDRILLHIIYYFAHLAVLFLCIFSVSLTLTRYGWLAYIIHKERDGTCHGELIVLIYFV
ncbi:HYDROLASE-LIKE PROTEIN FAMILY [Salix koriyanagi]|uniref:HYDROLASE-LIKE PROTEIN FAMILY n=1 Tax=Salix koriyanagi TaxID=2511006 RepID=A0A9Q0UEI9_9ROSI|nr:HYDROLASE-LIKE PROTEIN FAMILY [Salix koriyanagi]